eukprot:TRINITY_DN68205_c0_g1_i1.p2 TRINITY_DN68205_c0_g1~~TRINITY_DN68205_c0_g1_i1.p2  ORF type:complete len:106 (+),score=3.05 TRINITY_DN68205_c0_g1_i1:488-805(+)
MKNGPTTQKGALLWAQSLPTQCGVHVGSHRQPCVNRMDLHQEGAYLANREFFLLPCSHLYKNTPHILLLQRDMPQNAQMNLNLAEHYHTPICLYRVRSCLGKEYN